LRSNGPPLGRTGQVAFPRAIYVIITAPFTLADAFVSQIAVSSVSQQPNRMSLSNPLRQHHHHVQGDPVPGMLVSSGNWVTAVTYQQISGSVYSTVLLSIILAGIVVFIFTARPMLTLLATIIVVLIFATVMGILWWKGWHLGAIEGMSITSLVGLSVDYCIHLVEGHIHARAGTRRGNARCCSLLLPSLQWQLPCPRLLVC
jgi:predicted RND superfamily exporter protein